METILDQVSALEKEVLSLQEGVSALDCCLRSCTDDLEQYQRRNNLRVFGINETNDEDTDKLLINMFMEKLDVDIPVWTGPTEAVRSPSRARTGPSDIIRS